MEDADWRPEDEVDWVVLLVREARRVSGTPGAEGAPVVRCGVVECLEVLETWVRRVVEGAMRMALCG